MKKCECDKPSHDVQIEGCTTCGLPFNPPRKIQVTIVHEARPRRSWRTLLTRKTYDTEAWYAAGCP